MASPSSPSAAVSPAVAAGGTVDAAVVRATLPAAPRPALSTIVAAAAAGGAVGSVARTSLAVAFSNVNPSWWNSDGAASHDGTAFGGLAATFVINMAGTLVLALLARFATHWPKQGVAFLGGGVCGGATTFSTLMLETARLFIECAPFSRCDYCSERRCEQGSLEYRRAHEDQRGSIYFYGAGRGGGAVAYWAATMAGGLLTTAVVLSMPPPRLFLRHGSQGAVLAAEAPSSSMLLSRTQPASPTQVVDAIQTTS